ncbi:MAG TPA: hypothetical protein VM163_06695 [bacterium]|nr:hypothetical protein [bacterium]
MRFVRSIVAVIIPLLFCVTATAEYYTFPVPGDEVWELVSDTGVTRLSCSDRCSAIDGRNRLYVCNTGYTVDPEMRRWDGTSWSKVPVPEGIWSVCAGPDNIVLLGESWNLGYVRDEEYHEIEMRYSYSDWQFTTCFEDDTWVLSSGPEDGLQRTNWRLGGGDWLDRPTGRAVYEIDAWRGTHRWASCSDGLYYQENGAGWQLLRIESFPINDDVWLRQVEPYSERLAWALGDDGDLYHHTDGGLHNIIDEGAPIPNGPVLRIAIDRFGNPWCVIGNGQIARFDRSQWTHYTCPFLTGRVQDMVFDHFENLYVITNEMVVMMRNDWDGIGLDFECTKDSYLPGTPVGVNALVRNASWVGILADLYIAYQNKQSGELLFLPGPSGEIKPVIAGLWARRRSPLYMGYIDIGPAPNQPGEYAVLIGFTLEGRFDILSSNIATDDIVVSNPN